jgi:uncharacterized protein GlcG (DUF336 family)
VSADGAPANPEDLLIAYALRVPYVGQHGDDAARWQARFGDLVVDPEASLGMRDAPAASHQAELDWAITLSDAVTKLADEQGIRVSVAVVDAGGDPIQQDRMNGSAAATVDIALATAATAARFGRPTERLKGAYGAATAQLHRLAPSPFLAAPGGLPIIDDGGVVGGLGVGGVDPEQCAGIAAEVLDR